MKKKVIIVGIALGAFLIIIFGIGIYTCNMQKTKKEIAYGQGVSLLQSYCMENNYFRVGMKELGL